MLKNDSQGLPGTAYSLFSALMYATLSLLALLIFLPFSYNGVDFIQHLTPQQILVTLAIAVFNTLLADPAWAKKQMDALA